MIFIDIPVGFFWWFAELFMIYYDLIFHLPSGYFI